MALTLSATAGISCGFRNGSPQYHPTFTRAETLLIAYRMSSLIVKSGEFLKFADVAEVSLALAMVGPTLGAQGPTSVAFS